MAVQGSPNSHCYSHNKMADQTNGNDIPLLEHERGTSQTAPSHQRPKERASDEFGMPVYQDTKLKKRGKTVLMHLKSRKHAFINSLIHIPSIAITTGVLSLTFRNVFWEPPSEDTNAVLNSLQFAAQLHGSIIVMSLSAMLLHVVHHGLAGKRGVPLGFISASFQLNSLSYLFRREFTSLKIKYILIFLCAFALAILSGPSSAITMIPRLQFWSVDKLWLNRGSMDFRVYIEANQSSLYPETLTAENAPPQCFKSNAVMLSECPAYGMRQWIIKNDDLLISGSEQINRTIEGSWLRYMVGQTSFVNVGTQSVYLASTLSNFLGNALFAYENLLSGFGGSTQGILGVERPSIIQNTDDEKFVARYDLSLRAAGRTIATRKPVVQVECAGHSANSTSLSLQHGRMSWAPWNAEPISSTEWSVPSSDYSSLTVDLNSTVVNSSWIDIDQFGSIKPSLGVFFATPKVIMPRGCSSCPNSQNGNYSSYTCTVDARWVPAQAFSDASSGERAVFDFNPNPIDAVMGEGSNSDASSFPNIYLSESWVEALSVPWIDSISSPEPTNRTILDIIGQKCLDANTFYNSSFIGVPFEDGLPHLISTDPMKMLKCLQISLSVHLSEAISRVQDSVPTYFIAEGHNLKPYTDSRYYSKNVFLVQNLYRDIVTVAPDPSYDGGRIRNISKADFADPSRFTEIYIPVSRWGYGYGFQDSTLVYVGAVILLLHVALCVGYIAWTMGKGDYMSARWDSIGEMVLMAMQSGSPDARDEGASGKVDKKTLKKQWTERFAVREIATEGSDSGTISASTGTDQRDKTLVLRRVGDYESREGDLEARDGGVGDIARREGDIEGHDRLGEITVRENTTP